MSEPEGGPGPVGRPVPAPVEADVVVVAALPIEVGFLTDRLERRRSYAGPNHTIIEGEHLGKLVAVLAGGAGRLAARETTHLLLQGHRPRWVVSAGFAGALDPALKRNDAILPNEIIDADGGAFVVDVKVAFPDAAPGLRVSTGRLLTIDAIARTAAEKAALRERFHADVVDMETSAVAATCAERGLRFLSIRVVSDEATAELPAEVEDVFNRKGAELAGSALRAIWNRPSTIKDFWRLHSHAQEAADRLADVALAAIGLLPD